MLLFFIPEAKAVSDQLLRDHGLDRIILAGRHHRETFRGPSGGQGLLIADARTPAGALEYLADKQTWSPRFGFSSLVGTFNDKPPTPRELLREKTLPGESIRMVDGHDWIVPLLRNWRPGETLDFSATLPRVMRQSPETGSFVLGDVVPQYSAIWETSLDIANTLLAQLAKDGAAELNDAITMQFVCDLLAINYTVDASIVSHLQILTPELSGRIITSALDWDTLRAHLKKLLSRSTSGGTNSDSGATPPTEA
ncbi:hypothetical protein [Aureliella helgolandensis]|uniref:Uncharacterized protein n=1 Tax=Aureliella helgolandensis TaxID=2527968 RepID=A0A518G2V3_9BACT|nr:hypothetical protein [Aureliella helgolandensis]QDV22933.1 hypothetical protein Q31a_12260 [Aureliella helgolandensis]